MDFLKTKYSTCYRTLIITRLLIIFMTQILPIFSNIMMNQYSSNYMTKRQMVECPRPSYSLHVSVAIPFYTSKTNLEISTISRGATFYKSQLILINNEYFTVKPKKIEHSICISKIFVPKIKFVYLNNQIHCMHSSRTPPFRWLVTYCWR